MRSRGEGNTGVSPDSTILSMMVLEFGNQFGEFRLFGLDPAMGWSSAWMRTTLVRSGDEGGGICGFMSGRLTRRGRSWVGDKTDG